MRGAQGDGGGIRRDHGILHLGFRGFGPEEMPRAAEEEQQEKKESATTERQQHQETPESTRDQPRTQKQLPAVENDPIKRLVALTDADFARWMTDVMPPGTRCIYVVGLSVTPRFQGRGVGSVLLRWGTRLCDERRVFAWVHSSEPAWRVYDKAGFRTARTLDVDLDAYAPMPPPGEGPEAQWGHYVFRYMLYKPPGVGCSGLYDAPP